MFRRDMGWKFLGEVEYFPSFWRVTTSAFNISEGQEIEEAAVLRTLQKREGQGFVVILFITLQ